MANQFGIVADGESRLRKALFEKFRAKYFEQLQSARDHWDRMKLERKIADEVKSELKRTSSSYSLWFRPSGIVTLAFRARHLRAVYLPSSQEKPGAGASRPESIR